MTRISKADPGRVDTTPEIYSTKLAGLTNERLRILHKIQSGSTSMAIQSAEHRDMVNNDNFYVGDSVLQEHAQSALAEKPEKPEIKMGLGQIVDWKMNLRIWLERSLLQRRL